MKSKFILIIFLCSFQLFAQIPGYMGKRFTISYAAWLHPNVNLLSDVPTTKGVVLDYSHILAADYCVAKRGALCFTFQFSRMGIKYYDNSYNSSYDYTYLGHDKYPAYLNSKTFSIGYKLFASDKFAPVGKYIKWDALVVLNKLIYNPDDVVVNKTNTRLTEEEPNAKSVGGGLALSVGHQRVFYDKLVLDYGLRIALAVCPANYSSNYARNIFYYSTERTLFNQFVNFRIGIGFLAF
jgi:hypothetical protein